MKPLRKRLTYANVMSSLAVFLVLAGGTAFAAAKLGKNTVGTKQLKNDAVTSAKIKNGAVTGAKLKLSTVGTVPSATTADTANSANSAKTADKASTADKATTAQSATNAGHANTANTADKANTATVAGTVFTTESGDDILNFPSPSNSALKTASLNVPAGTYVVVGKVLSNNNSAGTVISKCQLLAAGNVIDNLPGEYISLDNVSDRGYIPLNGVAALPSGGEIEISCQTTTTEGNYLNRVLTATSVAAVG